MLLLRDRQTERQTAIIGGVPLSRLLSGDKVSLKAMSTLHLRGKDSVEKGIEA